MVHTGVDVVLVEGPHVPAGLRPALHRLSLEVRTLQPADAPARLAELSPKLLVCPDGPLIASLRGVTKELGQSPVTDLHRKRSSEPTPRRTTIADLREPDFDSSPGAYSGVP